jgi:uncharacterized membrane protein
MKDDRTLGERVSDEVAQFGGSWRFIFLFSTFLIIWLIFNSIIYFMPWWFDKNPYILLNLILSFVAAFQAPFIMMSQNRAEKKQDQAYRTLFQDLKELVEQDIECENEIKKMSEEIRINQELQKQQHALLLKFIKDVIALQEVNKKELEELILNQEDC